MSPLHIEAVGLFTSVGINAPQTVGSLRTNLQRFTELAVQLPGGRVAEVITPDREPLVGAPSPLPPESAVDAARLAAMGGYALRECVERSPTEPANAAPLPLLWCAPTPDQLAVDGDALLADLAARAETTIDTERSRVFGEGRTAVVSALTHAGQLLSTGAVTACYVGGADSLIQPDRLDDLVAKNRVLWSDNVNGFIPGEGAAVLRVTTTPGEGNLAEVRGLGAAQDIPMQAADNAVTGAGLSLATQGALTDAGLSLADIGILSSDGAGEHFFAKQLALALSRLAPEVDRESELPAGGAPLEPQPSDAQQSDVSYERWAPSLSLGETGAASGPIALAAIAFGLHAGLFTAVNALHLSMADDGARGAVVLTPPQSGQPRGASHG